MKKVPKLKPIKGKLKPPVPKVKQNPNAANGSKMATQAFNAGVAAGIGYMQKGLGTALDTALESRVWTGFSPKTPYARRNGEMMDSGARNIVDTGALKGSRTMTAVSQGTRHTISITYRSPYAAITHYGGVIRPYGSPYAQPVMLPARPWITATMNGTHGLTKFDAKKYVKSAVIKSWAITMS